MAGAPSSLRVHAIRARAAVAVAEGDHRTAANLALAADDSSPAGDFDVALLARARGVSLRRLGQRRAAIEQLSAARLILDRLGANPYLEQTDQELAACGIRRPDPSSGNPRAVLTPQELTVARLAAQGLTNRDNRPLADHRRQDG